MRISSPTQIQDFSSRICIFSCLFLPLKLPQITGSSCSASASSVPSFQITGFLSHPDAQTDPEVFTPEPANADQGLSTQNAPVGRKAKGLLPKPSTWMASRVSTAFQLFLWNGKEHGRTQPAIRKCLDSPTEGMPQPRPPPNQCWAFP